MFRLLSRKLRSINRIIEPSNEGQMKPDTSAQLSPNLQYNLDTLHQILGESGDVVKRELTLGFENKVKAALLYIDGLVNKDLINENILQPLLYEAHWNRDNPDFPIGDVKYLQQSLLSIVDVRRQSSTGDIVEALLYGEALLLVDGNSEALLMDCKGWPARGIEEPDTERTVRGSREGFNETVRMNTAMLRRKISNPDFMIENLVLGERSHTHICVAYLKGIVNPELVDEVKRRLRRIKIDAVLDSGYLEQLIEDNPLSPFATIGNSQKPDVIAARILEGRVAILADGSPMVITVPMLFIEGFQAAEDYYSRPFYVSFVRIMRYLAFFITLYTPALYVAMTTYHQELLPTPLLVTIAKASEGTPFPMVIETLVMLILFAIIREGGIRLPGPVGSALSIVGALIIGDAAVSAGLVGAPTVIVVAMTAVSSFLVVTHTDVTALFGLILTVMAGILGGFGIMIGTLIILIHLASLRSFGVPYLSPVMPFSIKDMKDTFIRAPLWAMITRPRLLTNQDAQRIAFRMQPGLPENKKRHE